MRGETFKAEFELFEFANEFASELSHENGGGNEKEFDAPGTPDDVLEACSSYYFGACLSRSSRPPSSGGDEPIRID